MATFVEGGEATFDAMLYGSQHPGTLDFLRQQFDNVGQHLSAAGRAFMEASRREFEELSESYAAQLLRSAGRAISAFWIPDEILTLNNIGHMQYAPYQMRRWIMANPEVRTLYHQGRVEGYGESYIDLDPGRVGSEHYDYRRATNGVVQFEEPDADGNVGFVAHNYFEALRPDDRELELVEQADILATWNHVRGLLETGKEDPTSKWGADIG